MKQVVALTVLLLVCVYVQSAAVDVVEPIESVESVEDGNLADGEIYVYVEGKEGGVSTDRHRQKRGTGLRNALCNMSCGGAGGTCRYRKGYGGSWSCRDDHVCVCD